jgi:hypothetical protein
MGRFSLKEPSKVEDRGQYQVTISNGLSSLRNLDDRRAINRALGKNYNIRISTKGS